MLLGFGELFGGKEGNLVLPDEADHGAGVRFSDVQVHLRHRDARFAAVDRGGRR